MQINFFFTFGNLSFLLNCETPWNNIFSPFHSAKSEIYMKLRSLKFELHKNKKIKNRGSIVDGGFWRRKIQNICRTRIFKKIGTQSKPVNKKLTKKSRRKNWDKNTCDSTKSNRRSLIVSTLETYQNNEIGVKFHKSKFRI